MIHQFPPLKMQKNIAFQITVWKCSSSLTHARSPLTREMNFVVFRSLQQGTSVVLQILINLRPLCTLELSQEVMHSWKIKLKYSLSWSMHQEQSLCFFRKARWNGHFFPFSVFKQMEIYASQYLLMCRCWIEVRSQSNKRKRGVTGRIR